MGTVKTTSKQQAAKSPITSPNKAVKRTRAAPVAPVSSKKVVAFNKIQVPESVPPNKQVVVGQRITSYKGGSLTAKNFYNFLVKTLGRDQALACLPAIYPQLSSEKKRELQAVVSSGGK